MISHTNLSHNQSIIADELQTNTQTICVSWLPQYHDVSFSFVLNDIMIYRWALLVHILALCIVEDQVNISLLRNCFNVKGYYLSPISFLKDPPVWVRCLSKYRATHTQVGSFAQSQLLIHMHRLLVLPSHSQLANSPHRQHLHSIYPLCNTLSMRLSQLIQQQCRLFIQHSHPSD